jgi:prevent-host-death family protein
MRYSTQVKPISYLKANAAEVLEKLAENRQPLIITQNGEARAVMQDVATYENTQETLALLKILALGQQQIAEGKFDSADDVFERLRAKQAARANGVALKTAKGTRAKSQSAPKPTPKSKAAKASSR